MNEAITVAERNRNVYMELSEYERHPGAEAYVQAANTIIPDKILLPVLTRVWISVRP